MTSLQTRIVVSQPFGENTYIAYLDGRDDCVVIDPGLEPHLIIERLDSEGRTPAAILNTHGHSDHIGGNAAMKDRWPDCPLVIGHAEAEKLTDANKNLSAPFGLPLVSPAADETVAEGDVRTWAGIGLEIFETPGHSIGHVTYLHKGNSPWTAFVGDVIFQGGIGRTDFPDGSFQQLAASIREKIFAWPDDTVLLSGHGGPTTVGDEKRYNPFVGERA
jgi:glyoxylase-like metal-dependent hydrolase (beta-lactamase superfamily II)